MHTQSQPTSYYRFVDETRLDGISCVRDRLDETFSIKDLSTRWPNIRQEFKERIDENLSFHYWSTMHERYTAREGPPII